MHYSLLMHYQEGGDAGLTDADMAPAREAFARYAADLDDVVSRCLDHSYGRLLALLAAPTGDIPAAAAYRQALTLTADDRVRHYLTGQLATCAPR